MAKALVVCPATGTEELIAYAATPFGPLIHACTRFRPATAVACQRACASGARCVLGRNDAPLEAERDDDTEIEILLPLMRR